MIDPTFLDQHAALTRRYFLASGAAWVVAAGCVPTDGQPNASACLNSDPERFFHFLLPRLMKPIRTAATP